MKVLLVLAVFGVSSATLIEITQTTTACEGSTLSLSCTSGVIRIDAANFGRTSSTVCTAGGPTTDTNCVSSGSQAIVQQQCDGKASCSIPATSAVFGDPCGGTYKYLQVTYTCIRATSTRQPICEGNTQTLSCPSGATLDITYANYGRTELGVCPVDPRPNTACTKNVIATVRQSCQGKASCTLAPSNTVYGPDPCSGTTKYLDVGYRCITTTVICQNKFGTFTCPIGQVMQITGGTYGRQDSTRCPNSFLGTTTNTNCNSPNGATVPTALCNNLSICTIYASNLKYGGDPCPGTSKYATVSYFCRSK